jgi:hypothetical protein
MCRQKKKIWIDLDNSPHVPFFKPIIEELTARGYPLLITARDCFQVSGLADLLCLECYRIGRHYGKNIILKVAGTLLRSFQLSPLVVNQRPDLAVSHGSRSQVVLAKLVRIPSINILDYEHATEIARPTWEFMPDIITSVSLDRVEKGIVKYHGIKEDVYVPNFIPDNAILRDLKLNPDKIIVTIRPPATEAHYHNPESEGLLAEMLRHLAGMDNVQQVILPRNDKQGAFLRSEWKELFHNRKLIIPEHVVDGLNLLWHSDLAISGGGTMNREAAALGVPVYSIFRGKTGDVDRYLEKTNRLVMLTSIDDIHARLKVEKRKIPDKNGDNSREALKDIVEAIVSIVENGTCDTPWLR